jgi:hypothetical protein
MQPLCYEPIYKTFEYMTPEGTWVTLWNQLYGVDEDVLDSDTFVMSDDGKTMGYYLSQEEYFKHVQPMFFDLSGTIEISVRVAYYNEDGIVIGAN